MTARLLMPLLAVALLAGAPVRAQPEPGQAGAAFGVEQGQTLREPKAPDRGAQLEQLRTAAERLPVAAGLAVLLALRPRRRGTPPRQAQVVQTQIILAVVGAVVMLVVGTSLARAFGIVGAAGLVRYRAKIDDPKDAGVMLSTLAVGLASGVGLWMLASFSTLFVLAVLWVVESFEPRARQVFLLTVKAQDPAALRPRLESLLGRHRLEYELRSATEEVVTYEVHVPLDRRVDRLSNGILKLDPDHVTAVEWEQKKEKK
ncbi:MAG: DUF4956 domain-containing protein [Vicinamibacterales bacterium]